MKLPHGERAIVDERKVRDYLLSTSHPVGRFKARVFAAIGYGPANWRWFRAAIAEHAAHHDAFLDHEDEKGRTYLIRGSLHGPRGDSLEVVSVWIVPIGEDTPRLVTVYPGRP